MLNHVASCLVLDIICGVPSSGLITSLEEEKAVLFYFFYFIFFFCVCVWGGGVSIICTVLSTCSSSRPQGLLRSVYVAMLLLFVTFCYRKATNKYIGNVLCPIIGIIVLCPIIGIIVLCPIIGIIVLCPIIGIIVLCPIIGTFLTPENNGHKQPFSWTELIFIVLKSQNGLGWLCKIYVSKDSEAKLKVELFLSRGKKGEGHFWSV